MENTVLTQLMNWMSTIESSTVMNLGVISILGYLVIQNQRKMKREFDNLKSSKSQDDQPTPQQPTSNKLVSLANNTAKALKNTFKNSPRSAGGVVINGKEYSLDFVPILRINGYLNEKTPGVMERLEALAEDAISNVTLQEEFVNLATWSEHCGSSLTQHGSAAFNFSIKRFKLAFDRNEISSKYPETILNTIFSEFDVADTLAGPNYRESAKFVATLSDSFVFQLVSYKLSAHDSAVLLSLMPAKRVAIHLDLQQKKRLKTVIRHFSSMVKTLNTTKVQKVLKKVQDHFVPIVGGNQKNDIKKFFEHMMNNMSEDTSYEFVISLRKQKISSKVVPQNVAAQLPMALPAGRVEQKAGRVVSQPTPPQSTSEPLSPVSISHSEVPVTPPSTVETLVSNKKISVDPSQETEDAMARAKNVFISFSESVDNDENVDIK